MVDPLATLAHLILPAITLGTAYAATITRMLRASMVDVLRREYILVARAMGLPPRQIVWHDAFRNALIPTVTVSGFAFGYMLAGTIITEVIFNIPGVGRLLYESILTRDYPVIQGIVLFNVAIFVLVNFLVDILYTILDPRIRY
jgi:peptide/nickel transport system permease protein